MDKSGKYSSHLLTKSLLESSLKRLGRASWWNTMIGPTISITTFLISSFAQLLSDNKLDEGWTLFFGISSLLLGFLIDRFIDRNNSVVQIASIEAQHSEMMGKIEIGRKIEVIGTATSAISTINRSIESAKKVYNTFVTSDGGSNYSSKEEEIFSSFKRFISKKGNEWHDIITINEVFDYRYMNVEVGKFDGVHKVSILKHNVPMINYFIIQYEDNSKEVFFGWSYRSSPESSNIFRSSDYEVVDMFLDHFQSLDLPAKLVGRSEKLIDYALPKERRLRSLDVIDKSGYWCTIAVHPKQKGESTARRAVNCGVIEITFPESLPHIEGCIVMDKDYSDRPIRSDDGIVYNSDKMYFEYNESFMGSSEIHTRTCVYKFGWNGDDYIIRGSRYESDDRSRVEVFGIKIDERDFDRIDVRSPSEVRRVSLRYIDKLLKIGGAEWHGGKRIIE